MNYHNITHNDMLNGDGIRVVLWVSGCNHGCKNCQNPQTWDERSGIVFDDYAFKEVLDQLSKDYVSGLTLSGGDPLYPGNRDDVYFIVQAVKQLFPTKTIWLYTGYSYEEVKDLNIMHFVDVLVDGPFIEAQKDLALKWRGSSNQRVIDVQKSMKENNVVLYCD